MKILVVDDEMDICEILQYNLEREGYIVDVAYSAEEAMVMDLAHYDLLLLDVMMEGVSGFEFAKRLKADPATADIPIIFTTALDNEECVVKGFNLGADDYIAKPLSIRQVKARVAAVLRRSAKHLDSLSEITHSDNHTDDADAKEQSPILSYQSLALNIKAKSLSVDSQNVPLTKIQFEILALLLSEAGKVYSREELLKACWGENVYVLERTVDVNITRLRKKIGKYGACIKTRFGYGYTFEKD